MQRTRLETFHQVVIVVVVAVVVVVVVRAYPPGTLLLRIAPPFLAVAGTGASESPPVSSDAPLPLVGGDAPPDKDSPAALGKASSGGADPGGGAAGVSKSLLMRPRIWSTNPCTCGSADTPLAFFRLAGMLEVKFRTPV